MKKVRWGILSTANIGVEKVIPGMLKSGDVEVVGIASRTAVAAAKAAKTLGIAKSYGSYEALLDDPEIEAIYNPLPNHLHVPLTLEATKRGKHVLCEKPIAITAKEAEALRSVPKGIHVAEAFMVRHHPQWIEARRLAQSGELGRLTALQVLFTYFNRDPRNVRNMADIGGGGLLDIGCYPVTVARYVFGSEPLRVVGAIERDPDFKTDRLSSGVLDFGAGRHLSFSASTQSAAFQRAHVVGTNGRFEIEIPFNAPPDRPCVAWLDRADGSGSKRIEYPICDQYQLQAEWFGRVVRGEEKLAWGVEDAIQNMRILDALLRSDTSGRWETP